MQNRFKLIATDGGCPVTIPLSIWGSPMLLPNCLNRYSDKDTLHKLDQIYRAPVLW